MLLMVSKNFNRLKMLTTESTETTERNITGLIGSIIYQFSRWLNRTLSCVSPCVSNKNMFVVSGLWFMVVGMANNSNGIQNSQFKISVATL